MRPWTISTLDAFRAVGFSFPDDRSRQGLPGDRPIDLQRSHRTIEISYLVGDAWIEPVPIELSRGPTC
jgi:hypothetical protein